MSKALDDAICHRARKEGTPIFGIWPNGQTYETHGPVYGPIIAVPIPAWLTVGAVIRLAGYASGSAVEVVEVDPRTCLVRGESYTWGIETRIIAASWEASS